MVRPRGMAPSAFLSYIAAFKDLGMKPCRVVQTIGSAPASKGFHALDGYVTVGTKREGYCAAVDLSVKSDSDGNARPLDKPQIKKVLAALARHGFVAWFRDWEGNTHIHAIFVAVRMKPQLCSQVRDYLHDRDGLAGHRPETFYTSPKEQDDILRAAFLSANPQ